MAIKFTDLPQLSGTPADTDIVAIVDVSEDVSKKITVADLVSATGLDAASVRTIVEGSDLDMGSNKVLFSNMYATEGDLPDATSYHGMFAHVHATGAAYFAHGGSWVKLANFADMPSAADIATAKSEAISTAAADATTKADQAEADAKAYADQVVAATIDAAPASLDTLNELAAALNDDANFASTVTASIATKADQVDLVAVQQSVSDLQTSSSSGGDLTTPYVSSEITYDENVGSQQYFASRYYNQSTGATNQVVVYDSSDLSNSKIVTPTGPSHGSIGYIKISRTHLIATNTHSDDVSVFDLSSVFAGSTTPSYTMRFNSDLNGTYAADINGDYTYAYGPSSYYARMYRRNPNGSISQIAMEGGFSSKIKAIKTFNDLTYIVWTESDAPQATKVRIYDSNGSSTATHTLDQTGFVPVAGDREALAISNTILALRSNDRQTIKVWNMTNLSASPVTLSPSGQYFRSVAASDDYFIAVHDQNGEISVYSTSNLSGTPTTLTAPSYIASGSNIKDIQVSGRKLFVGFSNPGVIYSYDLDDLSADPVIVTGGSSYGLGEFLDVSVAENLVVTRTENIIPNSSVSASINYLEDKTNDMQISIAAAPTSADIATAKSEAISTAAADATAKADQAEADAKAYADQAEADAKAYADQVVAATVDAAPASLDTLNELAAALNDDANFASTVTASIATKADQSDLDALETTVAGMDTSSIETDVSALESYIQAAGSANMVVGVSPENKVLVYKTDGTLEHTIAAPTGAVNFGWNIVSNGSKIVVSAGGYDISPTSASAIYVFDMDGSNMVQIVNSDAHPGDYFGKGEGAIAISDSKIVVGAKYHRSLGGDDHTDKTGAVYVYNLDGTGEVKILPSDIAKGEEFGNSVAISSSKVIVGSHADATDGAAYVFNLDGTGELKLNSVAGGSSYAYGMKFGASVAISETKMAVGSLYAGPSDKGSVHVYDIDGSNRVDIYPSTASGAQFGYDVALNSSKVVVGHTGDSTAWIYDLDGTNEIQISTPTGAVQFGLNVAATETKIIVGSKGGDFGGATYNGAAYIYDIDGTNELQVYDPTAGNYSFFGEWIDLVQGAASYVTLQTTAQTVGEAINELHTEISSAPAGVTSADVATAKSEAISTAAADATAKADQAEADAKAYADQVVAATVDAAPAALDTLNELAAALGDDANFASTVTASIATKADASALDAKADASTVTAVMNSVYGSLVITDENTEQTWTRNGPTSEVQVYGQTDPQTGTPSVAVLNNTSTAKDAAYRDLTVAAGVELTLTSLVNPAIASGSTDWPQQYFNYRIEDNGSVVATLNGGDKTHSYTFTPSSTSVRIWVNITNTGLYYINDFSVSAEEHNTSPTLDTVAQGVVGAINELHTEISSSSSSIQTSSDVDTGDTAAEGDVLVYDASSSHFGYVNLEGEINSRVDAKIATTSVQELSDVASSGEDTLTGGDFLLYDASTSKFGLVNFESEVQSYANAAANTAVANVVDAAPASLDTLNELAAALGDDANFASTVTASIATKADDSALDALEVFVKGEETASTTTGTSGVVSGNSISGWKKSNGTAWTGAGVGYGDGIDMPRDTELAYLELPAGTHQLTWSSTGPSGIGLGFYAIPTASVLTTNPATLANNALAMDQSPTEVDNWGSPAYWEFTVTEAVKLVIISPTINAPAVGNGYRTYSRLQVDSFTIASPQPTLETTATQIVPAINELRTEKVSSSEVTALIDSDHIQANMPAHITDINYIQTTRVDVAQSGTLNAKLGTVDFEGSTVNFGSATVTSLNVNPNIDAHLNVSAANTNEFLKWNGTDYEFTDYIQGRVASTQIEVGNGGSITASLPSSTLDWQDGLVHFGGSEVIIDETPTSANHAANKSYVDAVVAATVDAAPAALDTLNELAAALGDDANFASTVTASIATKADDAATTAALATKADDAATTAALATKATQSALDALSASMVSSASPTFTGSVSANNFVEGVSALSGTSASIDPSSGSLITHTLTGGTTYTYVEGWASGASVTLHIESAGNTVTWPSTKWVGGSAPDLSSTAGTHLINLWKVGSEVYGTYVGLAVSGPGAPTLILISAYREDSDTGAVYAFDHTDLSADPVQLQPTGTGAFFGSGVAATSPAHVVIGAWGDGTGGKVYVYDATDLSAAPTVLEPSDIGASDRFGISVAVSSNFIVVGSQLDDTNEGSNTGSVYVYNANDLSEAPTKLVPFALSASDYFGEKVACSDDYIAVSAPQDDDNGSASGSVFVWPASEMSSGNTIGGSATYTKLTPSDGASSDQFGTAIVISGTTLVVGSFHAASGMAGAGAAYVYDLTNLSTSPTKLMAESAGRTHYARFGGTLAMDGDTLVIGSWGQNVTGSDNTQGAAYVYDASNLGASPTKLIASDGAGGHRFGNTVAVKGNNIVIGASHIAVGATSSAGAAYVYDASDLSAAPVKIDAGTEAAQSAEFGNGIAIL